MKVYKDLIQHFLQEFHCMLKRKVGIYKKVLYAQNFRRVHCISGN